MIDKEWPTRKNQVWIALGCLGWLFSIGHFVLDHTDSEECNTTELKVAPEDVYMTRLEYKGLTLECANLGYRSISCNWEAWNKLREPDAEGFYPPEPAEDYNHHKSSTAKTVNNLRRIL